MEKSKIVEEITLAIEELKAGSYEMVFSRLTDLNDCIISDIKKS